jgi:hypothetical protein
MEGGLNGGNETGNWSFGEWRGWGKRDDEMVVRIE